LQLKQLKRINLSGLNFGAFAGQIRAQKLSRQRSGGGVDCALYASQTETAYETKKSNRERQAAVCVELAIDLTSCLYSTSTLVVVVVALATILCTIWQKFLPKSLLCCGGGWRELRSSLELIIHAGHVNMIVMPADDGRLTKRRYRNLRKALQTHHSLNVPQCSIALLPQCLIVLLCLPHCSHLLDWHHRHDIGQINLRT